VSGRLSLVGGPHIPDFGICGVFFTTDNRPLPTSANHTLPWPVPLHIRLHRVNHGCEERDWCVSPRPAPSPRTWSRSLKSRRAPIPRLRPCHICMECMTKICHTCMGNTTNHVYDLYVLYDKLALKNAPNRT